MIKKLYVIICVVAFVFLLSSCDKVQGLQKLYLDIENVKTEYEMGEDINLKNLKVYALFDTTEVKDITDKAYINISQYYKSIAGTYKILVFYGHLEEVFMVEVKSSLPEDSKTQSSETKQPNIITDSIEQKNVD